MADAVAEASDRLRATLRRHGLVRRPLALRRFIQARGLRFVDGNRISVFDVGADGIAAMLEAIESARDRIHLETYILRSDATGRRFLSALASRCRKGVAVRLLYDAFGSFALDPLALRELQRAGGDIVAFNPLRRFYPRWLPRRRDHRKLLLVDGTVGFLGGLNIGDEYNTGSSDGTARWRDTHVRVRGPIVRELEAVFLESWFRADGPDLPWSMFLASLPPVCGDTRCAVVADGPVYRRRMLRDLVVLGLRSAEQDARLTTPYFVPDGKILRALTFAARRGVGIELMLAGRTDHPVLRRAAHALLPRLLEAGVRVWEHDASMLHAKSASFDGAWAVVGTSNLDRQSFQHSYEVNLVVEGEEICTVLDEVFERDRASCRAIDATALIERSLWERFLDRISALVLRFI